MQKVILPVRSNESRTVEPRSESAVCSTVCAGRGGLSIHSCTLRTYSMGGGVGWVEGGAGLRAGVGGLVGGGGDVKPHRVDRY